MRDEVVRETAFEWLDQQGDVKPFDYVFLALAFGLEETEAQRLVEEWLQERGEKEILT